MFDLYKKGITIAAPILASILILIYGFTIIERTFNFTHSFKCEGIITFSLLSLFLGTIAQKITYKFSIQAILNQISIIKIGSSLIKGIRSIISIFTNNKEYSTTLAEMHNNGKNTSQILGFKISDYIPEPLKKHFDSEMSTIFWPTVPNPASGFVVLCKRTELSQLTINRDQIITTLLSMGDTGKIKDKNQDQEQENTNSIMALLMSTIQKGAIITVTLLILYNILTFIITTPYNVIFTHISGFAIAAILLIPIIFGILHENTTPITSWLAVKSEEIIKKIPILSSVYMAAKQIMQMLLPKSNTARKICLVQFPTQNIWTLGLITTENSNISANSKDHYHVFVGTTPNISCGILIITHKSNIIQIPEMSMSDYFSFLLSLGRNN